MAVIWKKSFVGTKFYACTKKIDLLFSNARTFIVLLNKYWCTVLWYASITREAKHVLHMHEMSELFTTLVLAFKCTRHWDIVNRLQIVSPQSSFDLSLRIYWKCTANACQRLPMPYELLTIVVNGANGLKNKCCDCLANAMHACKWTCKRLQTYLWMMRMSYQRCHCLAIFLRMMRIFDDEAAISIYKDWIIMTLG